MTAKRPGFSLIELILAMALFSFMLMIITTGFINVVRLHQAGIGSRNTQQNSRFGIDDIIRAVRSASSAKVAVASGITPGRLCLDFAGGVVQYHVRNDKRLYRTEMPQQTYDTSGCVSVTGGREEPVSAGDVHIVGFEPSYQAPAAVGAPPTVSIVIRVATQDIGLINNNRQCDPAQTGAQYCAVTTVASTASLRGVDAQ